MTESSDSAPKERLVITEADLPPPKPPKERIRITEADLGLEKPKIDLTKDFETEPLGENLGRGNPEDTKPDREAASIGSVGGEGALKHTVHSSAGESGSRPAPEDESGFDWGD